MTLLEVTARPFGPAYRGGGERYPTILARSMARREPVVFGYCAQGGVPRPEALTCLELEGWALDLPPFISSMNPLPTPRSRGRMRDYLASSANSVEFLHVHNLRTAFSATWLSVARSARRTGRFRILLTDHGARFVPLPRLLAPTADYYVAVSQFSLARLQALAPRPGFVLPPPVPDELMQISTQRPYSDRSIDLLYLGRFVAWKRADLVLSLAEQVEARLGRPLRVVLAGSPVDARYLEYLRGKARSARLHRPVEFALNPPDPLVAELYASSRACVLLSSTVDAAGRQYAAPELAPATPVEAAAFGTPTILSDHPGMREQIAPGMTGLLVNPLNLAPSIDAIANLLGQEDGWTDFSRAARRYVEEERTTSVVAGRFQKFLNDLREGDR